MNVGYCLNWLSRTSSCDYGSNRVRDIAVICRIIDQGFFDELKNPDEAHRRIAETTLDEVNAAARRLFDPMAFSSALVGPGESDALLKEWRKTCA